MWETVKWFTPILTLIVGVWIKYFIDNYLVCKNISIWAVLFALSNLGLFLCICCILLLRSFYRTNLKYITMFAKVEEKLKFDLKEREDSKWFPGDRYITWEKWIEERKGTKKNSIENKEKNNSGNKKYTSEDYLSDKLPDKFWNKPFKKALLSSLMQSVFIFFALLFFGSILLLIWNLLT
jgi:hypothetical protein